MSFFLQIFQGCKIWDQNKDDDDDEDDDDDFRSVILSFSLRFRSTA